MGLRRVSPVVREIDAAIGELDGLLRNIRTGLAADDSQFVGTNGRFDPVARRDHDLDLARQGERYNYQVSERARRVTGESGPQSLSPVERVAVAHAIGTSLDLRVEPIPDSLEKRRNVPKALSDRRQQVLDATASGIAVVDRYQVDDPVFVAAGFLRGGPNTASYEAVAFPAQGRENVRVDLASACATAEFSGGLLVRVEQNEGRPTYVLTSNPARPHRVPLIGTNGGLADPEQEISRINDAENVMFPAPNRPDRARADIARFALRAAVLQLDSTGAIEVVDTSLAMPSDEFNDSMMGLLTQTTVNAVLPPNQQLRVDLSEGLFGSSIEAASTPEPNFIRASSPAQLRAYLYAIGATPDNYADELELRLNSMLHSNDIGTQLDSDRARGPVTLFANRFRNFTE